MVVAIAVLVTAAALVFVLDLVLGLADGEERASGLGPQTSGSDPERGAGKPEAALTHNRAPRT
jgi:hypothetical protein